MRDNVSLEIRDRITDWLFKLVMRQYGFNIYSDESSLMKVYDSETVDDVDEYFKAVMAEFKSRQRDKSKLKKIESRAEELLGK